MAQQMEEQNKMNLEYLTPEVKSMLENLELGAIESQLDQHFCLNNNDSLNKKKLKRKEKQYVQLKHFILVRQLKQKIFSVIYLLEG